MTAQPNLPDVSVFLASSVHDMKNSISMLIGALERVIEEVAPGTSPAVDNLGHMLYETQRINSNLVQLLTLYKLGQDRYPFTFDEHDLGEFTQELAAQNRHLLDSRQVHLEVDCPADLYWPFDRDLVAGVINHAFNNAIHYTRDRIRLAIQQEDEVLAIALEDNGPGFPQHMLDDGLAAMRGVNFSTGSTGLGLYFSAVIAKLHRNRDRCGDIMLANGGPLGGGRFVLRLP